jgi:hypothetical protein
MQLLVTLKATALMELLPISILIHGTQGSQGSCARHRPTHPRQFHAVFDQMATGAFNHPCANQPPLTQRLGIVHVVLIPSEVVTNGAS